MSGRSVISLQRQCCNQICRSGATVTEHAVHQLPLHMAPALLVAAVNAQQHDIASCIVSNWPLPTLRIRDVLDGEYLNTLNVEMGFDVTLFSGITARKPLCRMTTLDLCGVRINRSFMSLMLQAWPLLSLNKEQLTAAYLKQHIIETADPRLLKLIEKIYVALSVDQSLIGRVSFGRLLRQTNELPAPDVIELRMNELLCHDQIRNPKLAINLAKDTKLEVKLDMVEFDAGTSEYLDFLIVSCLQSLTFVHVVPTSIILTSSPQSMVDIASEIGLHSAKVILEHCPHSGLSGLCLKGVDLSLAWVNWPLPQTWSCDWLVALGLHDCSLDVFHGVRPRGHARRLRWLVRLLTGLPNLSALDLGDNYLAENLGAILDAVQRPLERLRLACCDFTDADVDSLVASRHMASMEELDVESCTSGLHGDAEVMSRRLLGELHQCSALRSLYFANNSLTDANELCTAFSAHCWPMLESLDVSLNPISSAEVTKLVRAVLASCRHIQRLCLPMESASRRVAASVAAISQAVSESGCHDLVVKAVHADHTIVVFDASNNELEIPFFR